jgi:hypothetical protein
MRLQRFVLHLALTTIQQQTILVDDAFHHMPPLHGRCVLGAQPLGHSKALP